MKMPALCEGRLLRRYKRFLADVCDGQGRLLTIHCPNTGAMTGCAEPDSRAWFSSSDNPKRKYSHTLEFVETAHGLVSVNTGRANKLVHEALSAAVLPSVQGIQNIQPEVPIPEGDGRFDFKVDTHTGPVWIEVKSVTLHMGDGVGAFPDATSARAAKHVEALQRRVASGERGMLVFCAQHCGVERVTLAREIDPHYAQVVEGALETGLEVVALGCSSNLDCMQADRIIPFKA